MMNKSCAHERNQEIERLESKFHHLEKFLTENFAPTNEIDRFLDGIYKRLESLEEKCNIDTAKSSEQGDLDL